MFGMGMGELIVIAIVALLFLGPEKLPEAAKTISKGIRDFRRQTRELQQIVEDDHEIGGAIRDIKSALRGEEPAATAEERRRRAAEAARAAADNAAKAAEELAEGAGGPKTQRVSAGADVAQLTAGAPTPGGERTNENEGVADLGAASSPAEVTAERADSDPGHPDTSFLRPASGTVATTFQLGSTWGADQDTSDESPEPRAPVGDDDDDNDSDPADEAHG